MFQKFFLFALSFTVLNGVHAATPSPVFHEAKRILSNTKVTKYQHPTEVDEALGKYLLDCSGFIDYVLGRIAPAAMTNFKSSVNENFSPKPKRPLAKHFVWFFSEIKNEKNSYFLAVTKIRNLREGDMVAWLTPDDVESNNTGHVMIVAKRPAPYADEDRVWAVPVIDSTSSGHGDGDPRKKGGPNGLGRGTMGLLEGDSGRPAAYFWKGDESKRPYYTEIRMGRLR